MRFFGLFVMTTLPRSLFIKDLGRFVVFLLFVIPRKKVPFLSVLGQNTLAIFLLHGFIVRLAKKYQIFCYSEAENILFAVILSLSIIALLGNPWIAKWFHRLFTGSWISHLLKKRT